MDRGQALAQALDRGRERLVGAVHVGEQRVAAAVGRQLLHVEDAAHRRLGIARHVGVPFLAGHVLGILVGLDDQDLRMLGAGARRGRMKVQLAEAAAERLVLLVGELLVAEKDHQIVHQRVMDLLEDLVAERPGEIDAEDLRTDHRRELAHLDGLVSHWLFLTYEAKPTRESDHERHPCPARRDGGRCRGRRSHHRRSLRAISRPARARVGRLSRDGRRHRRRAGARRAAPSSRSGTAASSAASWCS